MIKTLNQILVFFLEIIMLISYGYFGMTRQWNLASRLSFSIVVVAMAIILWSIFAAPKSGRRLEMPYLAIFRMLMFSLPEYLLFQSGHTNFAVTIFVLSLITQTISFFTEK